MSEDYTRGREQGLRDALACARAIWDEAQDTEYDTGFNEAKSRITKAIEALLPRPDPVKELADSITGKTEAMDCNYADGFLEACRRLLSAGRIAE